MEAEAALAAKEELAALTMPALAAKEELAAQEESE
jgi:hypothetical protein